MQPQTPIIKRSRLDLLELANRMHPNQLFDTWGYEGSAIFCEALKIALMSSPETDIFTISCCQIDHMDAVFPREAVLKVFSSGRLGRQGFVFTDVSTPDLLENMEAASIHQSQAVYVAHVGALLGKVNLNHKLIIGDHVVLGALSKVEKAVLECVIRHNGRSSSEVADMLSMKKNNASNYLKSLADSGFLLRKEAPASSGGFIHFYYSPLNAFV